MHEEIQQLIDKTKAAQAKTKKKVCVCTAASCASSNSEAVKKALQDEIIRRTEFSDI